MEPQGEPAVFLPPEAYSDLTSISPSHLSTDLTPLNAWDIAVRYHEYKVLLGKSGKGEALRRISAQAVLDRARRALGALTHPVETRSTPLDELPLSATRLELDLEETLENAPLPLGALSGAVTTPFPLTSHDVWMSFCSPRIQPVVLCVDTSLSMTGEKLALTAVALAVVLLQFPEDPVGMIAFENTATVLKEPDERVSIQTWVERFLDVPAQGYTHLESGLQKALFLSRRLHNRGKRPSTVLISDGKYTAGKDPSYLASRFPHLIVLKMGRDHAGRDLCQELARKGRGHLREVDRLEALPSVMLDTVRSLLRGRSRYDSAHEG